MISKSTECPSVSGVLRTIISFSVCLSQCLYDLSHCSNINKLLWFLLGDPLNVLFSTPPPPPTAICYYVSVPVSGLKKRYPYAGWIYHHTRRSIYQHSVTAYTRITANCTGGGGGGGDDDDDGR
jgi:hypothetical protein